MNRHTRKEPYIFGDSVPFGPWTVGPSASRRYGQAGNGPSTADGGSPTT